MEKCLLLKVPFKKWVKSLEEKDAGKENECFFIFADTT